MLLLTIYLLNLWIGFQGKQAPAFIPSLCLPAIPCFSPLHNYLWLSLLVLNMFHENLEVCNYNKFLFLQNSRVEERMSACGAVYPRAREKVRETVLTRVWDHAVDWHAAFSCEPNTFCKLICRCNGDTASLELDGVMPKWAKTWWDISDVEGFKEDRAGSMLGVLYGFSQFWCARQVNGTAVG